MKSVILMAITMILCMVTTSLSAQSYTNIATGKPVTTLSTFDLNFNSFNLVDGNNDTAWGSTILNTGNMEQWVFVDLGKVTAVDGIRVHWFDPYYASSYSILAADVLNVDAMNFIQTVSSTGNVDEHFFKVNARYIGILCQDANDIVYAIREFEVLVGNATPVPTVFPWNTCYGGSQLDVIADMKNTADGGYVTVGYSASSDGDVPENKGNHDVWIMKFDAGANLEWQKVYGGSDNDYGYSIIQTTDGNYVVTGNSDSYNGDIPTNNGAFDIFVLKLDGAGNLMWYKNLGGTSNDYGRAVTEESDGGYLISGFTGSNDFDVSGNHGGDNDGWLIKLDTNGNIQWQKCLGGTGNDQIFNMNKTTDGGTIIAAYTSSNNGDVSGQNGLYDMWIVKINTLGTIEWQKCFGLPNVPWYEVGQDVIQTTDGGYLALGYVNTSNKYDTLIYKLDAHGNEVWKKEFGGSENDILRKVKQLSNNSYILVGSSASMDGAVVGNHGGGDIWMVNLASTGDIKWQKCLGGTAAESATGILETADKGFIIVGGAQSLDGDVPAGHGMYDGWIVRTDIHGNILK